MIGRHRIVYKLKIPKTTAYLQKIEPKIRFNRLWKWRRRNQKKQNKKNTTPRTKNPYLHTKSRSSIRLQPRYNLQPSTTRIRKILVIITTITGNRKIKITYPSPTTAVTIPIKTLTRIKRKIKPINLIPKKRINYPITGTINLLTRKPSQTNQNHEHRKSNFLN